MTVNQLLTSLADCRPTRSSYSTVSDEGLILHILGVLLATHAVVGRQISRSENTGLCYRQSGGLWITDSQALLASAPKRSKQHHNRDNRDLRFKKNNQDRDQYQDGRNSGSNRDEYRSRRNRDSKLQCWYCTRFWKTVISRKRRMKPARSVSKIVISRISATPRRVIID